MQALQQFIATSINRMSIAAVNCYQLQPCEFTAGSSNSMGSRRVQAI